MLDATHRIYDVLNEAADEIQQSTSATQGDINIGLLASVEDSVFEDFTIQSYRENPDVKITLHMLTRKEIWDKLENNQIDLAIMYLPDESIKNWKPYESKRIISDDLLFIHHDEKLSKKKRIKFADTPNRPWTTYPTNYYLSHVMREAYKNAMVDMPTSVAQFTTPEQLLRFSKQTGAYTALPNSFVVGQGEQPDTWTARFEPNIRFELAFVFRSGKDKIPRIGHFLAQFDQYLKTKDYLARLQEIEQNK